MNYTKEEQEKIFSALLDAVNRSPYCQNIPLPTILDDNLEALIKKYKYDQLENKDLIPKFKEPEKIITKEDLSKKLREKIKNLNKRRQKNEVKEISVEF
jgi:hypothetical protein